MPWKLSRLTVCWCSSSMAARPNSLAGVQHRGGGKAHRRGLLQPLQHQRQRQRRGVRRDHGGSKQVGPPPQNPALGSPARARAPDARLLVQRAGEVQNRGAGAQRLPPVLAGQILRAGKKGEVHRGRRHRLRWPGRRSTSSPTWSNWPCASSSSSRRKLAAARGDSERASFNSRPNRVEAPAIAILYTGVLFSVGEVTGGSTVPVLPRQQPGAHGGRASAAAARPGIRRPRPDAGEHVDQRHGKEHHVGEPEDDEEAPRPTETATGRDGGGRS